MAKKNFLVVARDTNVPSGGLTLGDKKIDFHGKTAKVITDPAIADDIDKTYGLKGNGQVWVERDERLNNHQNYHEDGVHTYFFGSTKKFAEGWERIFGKASASRDVEIDDAESVVEEGAEARPEKDGGKK